MQNTLQKPDYQSAPAAALRAESSLVWRGAVFGAASPRKATISLTEERAKPPYVDPFWVRPFLENISEFGFVLPKS